MLEADEAVAFRGVGRLNVAGTRFCTATLISRDGHRHRGALPLPPAHARAGAARGVPLRRRAPLGETAAVRRVVRAVTQPDFAFEGLASPEGVAADLALLELARPVPAEDAAAFATGDLGAEAAPLAIVSYARDRAQAPSIEAPCGLVAVFAGVAALDCAVNYGASGAPVLQGEGRTPAGRRRLGDGLGARQRAPGHAGGAGRPLDRAAARGAGRRAAGGVTWVAITRGLRPASRLQRRRTSEARTVAHME